MADSWGMFTAAGGVTAVLWLQRNRRGLGVTENEFWAAMWTLLFGAIVGGKILFVVLGWEHYARGELHLWTDFGVGFVFFGGLVGAAAAGGVFAAVRGLSFVRGADYFSVAVPIGHAIGRIGCFFAGCCHGRPPHPVQLYEAFGLALIALACRSVLSRVEAQAFVPGTAFRCYLVLYGVLRFLLDPLRGDGRPERFLGLSHQQGIALLVIVAALTWQSRVPGGRHGQERNSVAAGCGQARRHSSGEGNSLQFSGAENSADARVGAKAIKSAGAHKKR